MECGSIVGRPNRVLLGFITIQKILALELQPYASKQQDSEIIIAISSFEVFLEVYFFLDLLLKYKFTKARVFVWFWCSFDFTSLFLSYLFLHFEACLVF